MTDDAWFCRNNLEAMTYSAAFPAAEDDEPDCGAEAADAAGRSVACIRALGHEGRHIAAVPGFLDGNRLYAVIAAWPGSEPPERIDL